jgi:hypothetical protein
MLHVFIATNTDISKMCPVASVIYHVYLHRVRPLILCDDHCFLSSRLYLPLPFIYLFFLLSSFFFLLRPCLTFQADYSQSILEYGDQPMALHLLQERALFDSASEVFMALDSSFFFSFSPINARLSCVHFCFSVSIIY